MGAVGNVGASPDAPIDQKPHQPWRHGQPPGQPEHVGAASTMNAAPIPVRALAGGEALGRLEVLPGEVRDCAETYGQKRRPEPRIAARIHAALGDARTVVNVGAGAGSYEPGDRWVLAVEPSATMRAQRPPGAAPAIAARAETLPLDDGSVDAAMACVTIHHWQPPQAGLAELRRVARGPVVVFTFDLDALPAWQQDHLHEGLVLERPGFPAIADVTAALGGDARVERIPTPGDCEDGFFEAFWRR